ncbi:MAG: hypothetical protein Q7R54_02675 [bacterium]|nr:hypothetical protein [bacterium]
MESSRSARGFGLLETVIGVAIITIVFLALFGLLNATILVSTLAKAKAAATALADVQMEYIRGLGYDSIGTVGGIPSGTIPETAETTLNGLVYTTDTFVSYIDDPADGLGINDENGITTDYKRVRVAVSYTAKSKLYSVVEVTTIAPPGIETTTGGGTLQINVVNAVGTPVSGATVTVVNAGASPAVNLSASSNVAGTVFLPGAPAAAGYQITVIKTGYSGSQTYDQVSPNINPNPGHLTVAENQTTTGTFAIDVLASFTLSTYSPLSSASFSDSFVDASQLAVMNATDISSGALALTLTEGVYASSGSARSIAIAPNYLAAWDTLSAGLATSTPTSVLISVYDGSGVLVPDEVIPGNSIGFDSFPVSLENVSITTYPTLSVGAALSTSDTAETPSVSSWSISYDAGPTPLPDVPFTLTGSKTIGSTGAGASIYKTVVNGATDGNGVAQQTLEWDAYQLSIPGYDVVDACPAPPYSLSPGASVSGAVVLSTSTANALVVFVSDVNSILVEGATVLLTRTGYSNIKTSSACGGSYFGNISANTYTITISKTGYTTTVVNDVPVLGQTIYAVSFP